LFAQLGDGYRLTVRFDPAEPTLGAAIYNRETGDRNPHGFPDGQFIGWAYYHAAAPTLSLRSRADDEEVQLVKRYRLAHRTAYRSLTRDSLKRDSLKGTNPPGNLSPLRIAEARDGTGRVTILESASVAADVRRLQPPVSGGSPLASRRSPSSFRINYDSL
jgi:hypothetical protein